MQKYASVATDTAGNALAAATITVKNGGSAVLATIYASNAGAALVNPFTTEVDGTYEFYASDGRYDITVAKNGYGFDATDTADVLLEDPLSAGSPAALAVSQNDWAPVDATTGLPMLAFQSWRISASAPVTITGITAPLAHAAGLPITLVNVGANAITLVHQSASSTAQYRLICPTALNLVLSGTFSDAATLVYDVATARWRVLSATVASVAVTTLATALLETSGPTSLAIGAIADGQVIRRSGATAIGLTSPFTQEFVSTDQVVTFNSTLNVAHGLGVKPKLTYVTLKCATAEQNYSVGDEVDASAGPHGATDFPSPILVVADTTNVTIITDSGTGTATPQLKNKTTQVAFTITAANWRYVVRAWA